MSFIVTGCGRSGTNMALEILSGNKQLVADTQVENKMAFKTPVNDKSYLTKCDTLYFEYPDLKSALESVDHMMIVWCIRDPRDICLSHIRRGESVDKGGDCPKACPTSTPEGAISNIERMSSIYKQLVSEFPERVYLFRMEDFILDLEAKTKEMCEALSLPYNVKMLDFMDRMRNPQKKQRYKKTVDKSQIAIWKNWRTAYDGYFQTKQFDIEKLFQDLDSYIEYFGYKESSNEIRTMHSRI